MRLFLLFLLLATIYQCAGPNKGPKRIELTKGVVLTKYHWKLVENIRMVGDKNLTVFFTDKTKMKLEVVEDHLMLLE